MGGILQIAFGSKDEKEHLDTHEGSFYAELL